MQEIGDRIRVKRKELHLTMKQLHTITGLSTGNLSDIENKKYLPSIASLLPLSRALKCSIDWIVTGEIQIPENISDDASSKLQLANHEEVIIKMLRDLDERDREDVFDIISMKHERRQNSLKERERFQQSTSPSGKSDTGDNHITA